MLYEELRRLCEPMTAVPYSLNDSLYEMLILHSSETIITCDGEGEIIDLDEHKLPTVSALSEYCKRAEAVRADTISEAERWFKIAADIHFTLEAIYSGAMCFEKNEELAISKRNELAKYLELA